MFNRTFLYTSLFSALFMLISLKFMALFTFIKWSPVGFLKNEQVFPKMHSAVQWLLLYVFLFLLFAIIYILFSFLERIPPSIPAIGLSLFGVFLLEWFIDDARTPTEMIRAISIPLLSVIAITLRFISGTASFNKELSQKE